MQEYGPKGVQTLVAMPGFFRTNLLADARGPARLVEGARRIMEQSHLEADTVAAALLAAAAAGTTHWTYPRRYRNLWRLKRLIPSRFQRLFPALAQRQR
jgi:short-subunit dehydrogenase